MRNKVSGLWALWHFEAYVSYRSVLTSLNSPFGIRTLGSAPLTLLEASLEPTLVMVSRIAWGSALIFAISPKRLPFSWIIIFWKRKNSQGVKLGDWALMGTDSVLLSVSNCWKDEAVRSGMLARRRTQSWVRPCSARFLVISSLKRLCTSLNLRLLSSLITLRNFPHFRQSDLMMADQSF